MAEPKTPPLQARDKLAFLLALVPYLVDHERVTVEEAAAHFRVPASQIRDAVNLIAVSGLPGETAAYQHEDLFDIDWDAFEEDDEIVLTHRVAIDDAPRFSAREAAALIAGLQYLSALPENADRASIASLMGKLSRGASGDPVPLAVEGPEARDGLTPTLAAIRDSVERGVQLEIDYRSASGDAERRRVDALRVESIDDDWYLRGWCHLRQAVRTFRLDRIVGAHVTDEPIRHHASDVRLPELFAPSPDDTEVILEVAASALPLVADFLPEVPRAASLDARVRVPVRVQHIHGVKRLVAGMPGVAELVGPEEARRTVAEWAQAALDRYRG